MSQPILPMLSNVSLKTTLPDGTLVLAAMSGMEAVSSTYQYDLDLFSAGKRLESAGLLRQPMTVSLQTETIRGVRHFHGLVTRFSLIEESGDGYRYRATLAPRLFLLSRTKNCRVFRKPLPWELRSSTDELEGKTSIPNIVKHILTEHLVEYDDTRLSLDYPELEYVVQYRESDLDFIRRLLEDAGIYYYFRHESDRHVLMLVDNLASHPKEDDCERLPYHNLGAHGSIGEEHVYGWSVVRELHPSAVAGADYHFAAPTQNLHREVGKPGRTEEIFEYPAGYRDPTAASEILAVRYEELEARFEEYTGVTNARSLLVGRRFELTGHPQDELNGEFFVTEAHFQIAGEPDPSSGRADRIEDTYAAYFTAIQDRRQYRPPRRTFKPVMSGPQTAVVMGKPGEDVSIDEHGRVAVRFHWERYAAPDEASSCLARVSQVWAGNGYGMWAIPRIGQEVVVEFLDGDPDRPIVTGCVYNGVNRPPFEADAAQFGIRSRSTKGGGPQHFNELRLDDRKGKEELFVQAQNRHTTIVHGPQTIGVAKSRHLSVGGDETTSVGGNRTTTVQKNDVQEYQGEQAITVERLHSATYQMGRVVVVEQLEDIERITGGENKKTTTVEGQYAIQAGKGFRVVQGTNDMAMTQEGGSSRIELSNRKASATLIDGELTLSADSELALVCGDAGIVLQSDGTVTIYGTTLESKASTKLCLKAADGKGAIELAGAGASISGAKASLSSAGTTEITGQVVRIN